jgi:hypothetical protein
LGCDEAQGFLISEAVAPEQIAAYLEHGRPLLLSMAPATNGTKPLTPHSSSTAVSTQ